MTLGNMLRSIILLWGLLVLNMYAVSTGVINIQADVQPIERLTVNTAVAESINDLGEFAIYKKIASIECNSNSANGFNIQISSSNKGKLIRAGSLGIDENDNIVYTLELVGVSGSVGSQEPEMLDIEFNSSGQILLEFNQGVTSPTIERMYNMFIIAGVKSLYEGIYEDTLTITISNL